MKIKQITLKGYANNTNYFASENSKNDKFYFNYKKLQYQYIDNGYKCLDFWDTLKGKNATEKIIIKAYFWRGSWNNPTKEKIAIFYK